MHFVILNSTLKRRKLQPLFKKILYSYIVIINLYPSVFAQNASLVAGNGSYYTGSTGVYTVLAGNIYNDGNINTYAANWNFMGYGTTQRVTCLAGSDCPFVFNSSTYNTNLGNVNQNNSVGIDIETNTTAFTHAFTQGSTKIREGNYWLVNSGIGYSLNDAVSKFFITTGSYHGLLRQSNIGSDKLFPIGSAANSNDYTPATLNYAGTADVFGLRVFDNVYYNYFNNTNGDQNSIVHNYNFVKKTWIMNKGRAVPSPFADSVQVKLQWNLANEDPGFTGNRNDDISIVRNHDTIWFPDYPLGPATGTGSGPFTKTGYVPYDNGFYNYYPISVSGIEIILPVSGLKLSASLNGKNDANLHWVTLTEVNTSYFVIEKSIDGRTFKKIGTTLAAGNSQSQLDYNFTDANLSASTVYYRVVEYDKNGRNTYSNVAIVQLKNANKEINIFPNPVTDYVKISFKNTPGDYTVDLYNAIGQRLYTDRITTGLGTQFLTIYRKAMAAGTYYLKITNRANKDIKSVKLIISN